MSVRFASFNVENLFARPRAFNQATWAAGQPILDAYAEFNSLIALATYTPAAKTMSQRRTFVFATSAPTSASATSEPSRSP
jgi:hypothetical protein